MSDYGGTFEDDFFPDTHIEHIELVVLNDLWQDLQVEFATNDWEMEAGLRRQLEASA